MAILIRGAGDIATGIALRLHRSGFQIVMTDLPQPTSLRRTVCFSEALRLGTTKVEDVTAQLAGSPQEARALAEAGTVAVLAVMAGNDMLVTTDYRTQIPQVLAAVEDGTVSEETLDNAVVRVLRWKQALGLLGAQA